MIGFQRYIRGKNLLQGRKLEEKKHKLKGKKIEIASNKEDPVGHHKRGKSSETNDEARRKLNGELSSELRGTKQNFASLKEDSAGCQKEKNSEINGEAESNSTVNSVVNSTRNSTEIKN